MEVMLWFWVFTLSRTGFPCWVEDLGVALTVPAGGSGLGRDLSYGQRGPQTSRGFRGLVSVRIGVCFLASVSVDR